MKSENANFADEHATNHQETPQCAEGMPSTNDEQSPTQSSVMLDQLRGEIDNLPGPREIKVWMVDNLERCGQLDEEDLERLRLYLSERKISQTYLERRWLRLLNLHRQTKMHQESDVEEVDYVVLEHRIYKINPGHSRNWGEPKVKPLCNFEARIMANIRRDDTIGDTHHFEIVGTLYTGESLPKIIVTAEEFYLMKWPLERWGARVNIEPYRDARDQLRHAIQKLSEEHGIAQRRLYTHTGWECIDGKWVFLHGNGAIGMDNVEVKLEGKLSDYSFPLDQAVSEVDAMRASLHLLDAAPMSISYPLWAFMYLAPLAPMIDPAFVLWIEGPSGGFKSSFAAVMLNHFGCKFNGEYLPANWSSTGNSLEKQMYDAKDVPLLIDDVNPSEDKFEKAKIQEHASRVIRSVGNRTGRGRLNSDLKAQQTYEPRGLVWATAELGVIGKSVNARILTVAVEPDAIDPNKLSEAQAQSYVYSYAMAGYLRFLAPTWDSFAQYLQQEAQMLRKQHFEGPHHRRLSNASAQLATAFKSAMRYAVEIGAISQTEADCRLDECLQVLKQIAKTQNEEVQAEDPASRYLQILINLLCQKKVQISGTPTMGGTIGEKNLPNAEWIGWADGTYIYLVPGAYNLVCAYAAREGWAFPRRDTELRKDLARQGILAPTADGETTEQMRDPTKPGVRHKVRRIYLDKFLALAESMGIPRSHFCTSFVERKKDTLLDDSDQEEREEELKWWEEQGIITRKRLD